MLPWFGSWLYQDKGVNECNADCNSFDIFSTLFVFEFFDEAVVQGSGCRTICKDYASFSFIN
jgi:hypothetical protein